MPSHPAGDKIRVVRIIEYVGERHLVEKTLSSSIQVQRDVPGMTIKVATLGLHPEVLPSDFPLNLPSLPKES